MPMSVSHKLKVTLMKMTADTSTLCLKNTTLTLHTITSMHISRFRLFLREILLSEYAIEW